MAGRIRKRKFLIGVVLLLLIGAAAAKQFVFTPQKQRESTIVKMGTLREELTLSGKIEADEHAQIGFQTGGQLAWVGVKEGDYVGKFQTIASLDQRQLQKQLQKYLTTYSKQRNTFDQTLEDNQNRKPQEALNDKMKRVLENNQFDLNQTITDVEIHDLSIKLSSIITPIDGIVTRVETPQGGINLALGQRPFEIVNPQTIYFNIDADQTEVVQIHEGDFGEIILDAYPQEQLRGTVRLVSFTPNTDETGTVYSVKVDLDTDNSSYRYRLGMTGDISFVSQQKENTLYLPSRFIRSDNQGSFVYISPKKEKKYIVIGLETETDTEILKGLKEADVVYDQSD